MQNTMGQVTTSAEQMLKGHKEVLMFGGRKSKPNVLIRSATKCFSRG
jgi:subfamily B ATP-binding cassette protein MsbA